MENLNEPYVINFKNAVIKVSDGSLIKGKVNIGENFHRLSDFFKHSQDQFVILVSGEQTQESERVFFINKNYIIWTETGD